MSQSRRWFLGAVLLGLATKALGAPILWIDDNANRLGKVDVATGATTSVGIMPVSGTVTDIAFDPSGNLWATTFTSIYRINRDTAAATFVGNHGITFGNALVFDSGGTLYAAGGTTNLYTINTATGAGTSLGSMGFASAGDLAFNGGDLFLSATTNQLVKVNIGTPSLSAAVGPLGVSEVFGLATGDDGVLYATADQNVYSVNTLTGAATFAESWAGEIPFLGEAFGTAFVTEAGAPPEEPPPTGAPEPSSLALLAAGLLALAMRRRRVAT